LISTDQLNEMAGVHLGYIGFGNFEVMIDRLAHKDAYRLHMSKEIVMREKTPLEWREKIKDIVEPFLNCPAVEEIKEKNIDALLKKDIEVAELKKELNEMQKYKDYYDLSKGLKQ